jgi:hypothetical protein
VNRACAAHLQDFVGKCKLLVLHVKLTRLHKENVISAQLRGHGFLGKVPLVFAAANQAFG